MNTTIELQELTETECATTEGGITVWQAVMVVVGAANFVVDAVGSFCSGFADGFNSGSGQP